MPYCCQFCGEYFRLRKRFDVHIYQFHKSVLFLAHACDICGEKFAWFGDLTDHLVSTHYTDASTHDAKPDTNAQCEICGKIMQKTSLRNHVLIHSDKKPFSCDLCGLAFVSLSILNVHRRSHSEEKKYECDICKKKFKYSTALSTHRKNIHTQEKPWSCNVCGKLFPTKIALKYHLRTHTKEQPYQCTICSRRFKKTAALKVHLRVHTKEKPFSCFDCGKTFSHKVSLVKYHRCPNANVTQIESNTVVVTSEKNV